MNMKTWIPFLGILLNLNSFFAAAASITITGQNIFKAIRDGDLAAIQGFIDAGVNFNQFDTDDYTPLIYAIERDRIEIARAILAAPGIDINCPLGLGVIPIYHAAYSGKDEMIRLLLADERCARNQVGQRGKTPLHVAASVGNTSAVKILLEDPTVDRNIISRLDFTALDFAISHNHSDTVIVLLNDHLVVKDRIDGNGMTILHKISQYQEYDEIRRADRLRILEAILSVGVIDVNHQDRVGKTALHYAAESGDPEFILRLTAAGAYPEIEDESGHNAVYCAEQRRPALEEKYLEALDNALSYVGLK